MTIGCAVLLRGLDFCLMDSHFAVPKKIVRVASLKYIFESAISMASSLIRVFVNIVTKDKSRIHLVAGRGKRKGNSCNGTKMLASNNSS